MFIYDYFMRVVIAGRTVSNVCVCVDIYTCIYIPFDFENNLKTTIINQTITDIVFFIKNELIHIYVSIPTYKKYNVRDCLIYNCRL